MQKYTEYKHLKYYVPALGGTCPGEGVMPAWGGT